jgi:NTE family protein
MKIHAENSKTALVLPGGGARGAFQVGVLRAIAEMVPHRCENPFPVISGTSAGAINSIVLASKARRFRVAVAELERVWGHFHSKHVFRSDSLTMLKSSLQWFGAIVTGGLLVGTPKSLLDNAPLRSLLSRNIRFPRIQKSIDDGYLHAVAVTAAGYGSARSASFFQAVPGCKPWMRTRRGGIRQSINLDHLMASIAVPMIFPPVMLGGEYFGDGAMRQATPLSPAIHLGADRILVVGVRDETADRAADADKVQSFPSLGEIAGYMLDTLFMDGLYSDLEHMTRVNQLIDSVPEEHRRGQLTKMRAIDTMIIVPSQDLREIAHQCRTEMPRAVRALLRGVAGRNSSEGRLLSYLLFEQAYTRELIKLGYQDAMKVKDQLFDFICGKDVPRLFAPDWVKKDLSGFESH